MNTFEMKECNVKKIKLDIPSLQDISKALSNGLNKNFSNVDVKIVNCPDLRQHPFNLLCEGLGGNPTVIQIGDRAHFINMDFRNYNFCDIPKALNLELSYIFGSGGGYEEDHTTFSEMVADIQVVENEYKNNSKLAFSRDKTVEGITLHSANVNEKRFSVMGSFFASQGKKGKEIIRISCKKRKGEDNFPTTIINALNSTFSQPIALGTIIFLKKGKAVIHVPPERLKKSIKNSEERMKWFLRSIAEPTFLALGTILSSNPVGWNLTLQHFHGSNGKIGGHYHFDVNPEDVEYEAYVIPAENLCSIDVVDE